MKSQCLTLLCAFAITLSTAGEQEMSVHLCSNARRSGTTNEWWLSAAVLDALPKWNPEVERVPLSLDKAINLARRWAIASEKGTSVIIQEVSIKCVYPREGGKAQVFYYKTLFEARAFDYLACVVLMNGTVLEPSVPSLWLFSMDDIIEPRSLITKLRQAGALPAFLSTFLSERTRWAMNRPPAEGDENLRYGLGFDLNRIISGDLIYNKERFLNTKMSDETISLLGQPAQGDKLMHLNRLLLTDAYPGEFRPPRKLFWSP